MLESGTKIVLTREQLYERVWSTPMQKLAAEFGLSDVGLAKVCKRHQIPRPPRGYWAKLEHGKRVDPYPLSEVEDESLKTIELWQVDEPSNIEAKEVRLAIDPKIAALIEAEQSPANRIVRVRSLRGVDPLIKATQNALSECKPDEYGRLHPPQSVFHLRVSKNSLRRALLLVETVIRALRQRGYRFEPGEGSTEPKVEILGRSFTLSMWESSNRRQLEQPRGAGSYWRFRNYEYIPSGDLELTFHPVGTIRDTETKPLESRLPGLFVRILKAIDKWQVEEEIARIKAEEKQARKSAAIDQEVTHRKDSVRLASLSRAVTAWEEAQPVRGYINAVRAEANRRLGSVDETSEVGRWLMWAEAYLGSIDPLDISRGLPNYTLSETELARLRKQCEADWRDWSESFVSGGK